MFPGRREENSDEMKWREEERPNQKDKDEKVMREASAAVLLK